MAQPCSVAPPASNVYGKRDETRVGHYSTSRRRNSRRLPLSPTFCLEQCVLSSYGRWLKPIASWDCPKLSHSHALSSRTTVSGKPQDRWWEATRPFVLYAFETLPLLWLLRCQLWLYFLGHSTGFKFIFQFKYLMWLNHVGSFFKISLSL